MNFQKCRKVKGGGGGWREVEFRQANRERRWQYEKLEAELGTVKSFK